MQFACCLVRDKEASNPPLLSLDSMEDEEEEHSGLPNGYVGSYGRLLTFLRHCRRKGVLDECDFGELVHALEDVSHRRNVTKIDLHNTWFGTTDLSTTIALAGGNHLEEAVRFGRKKSTRPDEFRERSRSLGDTLQMNSSWLHSQEFNCRTRGDVAADAEVMAFGIGKSFDLSKRFKIPERSLVNWIVAVGEHYIESNPYHNWLHAVDVFQFCFMSLTDGGAGKFFSVQDLFALLTSTIAHDVGHPGTNNAFLVNSGAKLAITYNDRSPLENMHASIAFDLLHRPDSNFLINMPKHEATAFRGKFIDAVLATDPSNHIEIVDRFSGRVGSAGETPFMSDPKDRDKNGGSTEDRHMLMQVFIHMSDISNCCRPWDVYKETVFNLESEFFLQGDQERALGVPILPLMDRYKDSLAASQGFWISKFVGPLLDPFSTFMSEEFREFYQSTARENNDRFAKIMKKHGKKTAAEVWNLKLDG